MTSELLNLLPAYKGNMQLINDNQMTSDIIKLITEVHKREQKNYDKISEKFWQGNVKDTAKYLFDFLRKNVKYRIEPGNTQTVKTPSAILKEGYGDCKHYASFIVGVCDSLNRKGYPIEGLYMYVNSYTNTPNYHHVFAVVKDTESGKEWWVDPIEKTSFDQRKNYVKSKIVPMALYALSGDVMPYGLAEVGKKNPKVSKQQKQANKQANKQARKDNRAARKEEKKAIKALPKDQQKAAKKQRRQAKRADKKEIKKNATGAQKTAHIVLKVPNAISRGSFCTLLKLNAFRMASKIAAKAQADPTWAKDLKVQWHAAGGEWQPLKQAINQGVNVWNAKHAQKVQAIGAPSGYVDTSFLYPTMPWQTPLCNCHSLDNAEDEADAIGADPYTWASIAAVVAAAMPLILKLTGLLKKADVNTDQLNEDGMDATEEVLDEYNDSQEYPTDEDEPDNFGKSGAPQYGIKAYNRASDGQATVEYTKSNINDNGDVDYSGSNLDFSMVSQKLGDFWAEYKTPILIGGGVLVGLKFLPDIISSFKPTKRRK